MEINELHGWNFQVVCKLGSNLRDVSDLKLKGLVTPHFLPIVTKFHGCPRKRAKKTWKIELSDALSIIIFCEGWTKKTERKHSDKAGFSSPADGLFAACLFCLVQLHPDMILTILCILKMVSSIVFWNT